MVLYLTRPTKRHKTATCKKGEEFNISQSIIHKFSNLHLMLQSLNLPITFEGFKPYSIFLFKVDNNIEEFGYRDEINTLTFSLLDKKDFGLVISFACRITALTGHIIKRFSKKFKVKFYTLSNSRNFADGYFIPPTFLTACRSIILLPLAKIPFIIEAEHSCAA